MKATTLIFIVIVALVLWFFYNYLNVKAKLAAAPVYPGPGLVGITANGTPIVKPNVAINIPPTVVVARPPLIVKPNVAINIPPTVVVARPPLMCYNVYGMPISCDYTSPSSTTPWGSHS